jgi:hypothetical protein
MGGRATVGGWAAAAAVALLAGCAQQDAQAALGQVVKAATDAVSGGGGAPTQTAAAPQAGATPEAVGATPAGGSVLPVLREAIQLCMASSFDAATARQAFTKAGWTYEPEDWGGGEIHDWYLEPSSAVTTLVMPEPPRNGECRVVLNGVKVTEALAITEQALTTLHPGKFAFGEMERSARIVTPKNPGPDRAECTGWIGWFGQQPVMVNVTSEGNDPYCADSVGSQITIRS